MAATTIYRATRKDGVGLEPNMCWCEDYETAEAYTDNQGFGGSHIREMDVELVDVLDITGYETEIASLAELAEALDYDDSDSIARYWWQDAGWRYPWEESGEITRLLRASEYQWLRYEDDYPEGAITLMYIGTTEERQGD